MKDFRKFCRPKTIKNPDIGDVLVLLNCGNSVYVDDLYFQKIKKYFKKYSIVGNEDSKPGNIIVYDPVLDENIIINPKNYQSKFLILDVVGNKSEASAGDITAHNSILDLDATFTYSDWIELDNSWIFKEIYGVNVKVKNTASVGDIVIKANDTITFVVPNDWSKVSNNWEAIGIVCIESRNTPDEKVRILSLDYMDYNNPTRGNSGTGVYMYWGASGSISGITNRDLVPCMSTSNNTQLTSSVQRAVDYARIPTDYFNVESSAITGYKYTTITDERYCPSIYLEDGTLNPDALATVKTIPGTSTEFTINNANIDFDGVGNTLKIMLLCTAETPINSYNAGNYPAAQCCSLYNKGGLSWYLPASGELACIVANFSKLNSSRTTVGFISYGYSNYLFWSSTLHNSSNARIVSGTSGTCGSFPRSYGSTDSRVLAVSAF